MKASRYLVFLLAPIFVIQPAEPKSKKQGDVPTVFQTARSVYVEADQGDITRLGVYSEDRQAVSDVQSGLLDWNRYTVVPRRDQADLILVVRRGRLAATEGRGNLSVSARPGPSPSRGGLPGSLGSDNDIGAASEAGPDDDLLAVYSVDKGGEAKGPIWRRQMVNGLKNPGLPLFKQLRKAVDQAYPMQPARTRPGP